MSMSDYHPESWNPSWSIATIILGLQSFMLEDTPSAGCVSGSESQRKRMAFESIDFNRQNSVYKKIFGESEEAAAMTTAGAAYFGDEGQGPGGDSSKLDGTAPAGNTINVGTTSLHAFVMGLTLLIGLLLAIFVAANQR